ncbi:uncharacterized protein corn isoform X2 [Eurosta solidaginis]|uniref:uncharacterized protein corn isoform X2 n=1 Tax=Eurosta solidaginis TaxID=178769 RepID=UPI003530AEE5
MSAIMFSLNTAEQETHESQNDERILDAVATCNGIDEQISCRNEEATVATQLTTDIRTTPNTIRTNNDSLNYVSAPMSTQFDNDDCAAILESQMAALELTECEGGSSRHSHCDGGSDSGLDTATTKSATIQIISVGANNIEFHRALSSNSGGYASSGGLDEAINLAPCRAGIQQGLANMSDNSCLFHSSGSDAISAELAATSNNTIDAAFSANQSFECYSENGSESSSMLGGGSTVTTATPVRRTNSVSRGKVRAFETGRGSFATPMSRSVRERGSNSSTPISTNYSSTQAGSATMPRIRAVGIKRTSSLSRHVPAAATTKAQHQSDRQPMTHGNSKTSMPAPTTTLRSSTTTARVNKPQKPDSLPNRLSRTQSMSMQRLVQHTPSLSRARTPCTPSEDGRWPGNTRACSSAGVGAARRGVSVTPDLISLKMRSSNMMASMEVRSTNCNNPYSTLPRRRKQKSFEDLSVTNESRSSSVTRDTRMTTSVMVNTRRSLVSAFGATTPQNTQTRQSTMHTARKTQVLTAPKTRIYHETSSQTALTCDDLEKAFAGRTPTTRAIDAVDQHEQTTQTDLRDAELERLRDEVRQLSQREHEINAKLQREREEKLATQRELHLNTERVMSMLEMARIAGRRCGRAGSVSVSGLSLDGDATTPTSDEGSGSGHDSLLMLESQIQMSGHELIERQHEIGQLRQLCRSLQLEMERSLAAQECLLQEKVAIEQESSELQDFLQHEKSTLCDALKELESEHQACKQQLAGREEEVKVLRDECRHLVRLNEQRRQENRMLQTKYIALENKSKEMMMQQNYSVSGASAALSGLHSRLDSLVEQLVSTYNITDHDLEDIAFQPEAQQIHNNSLEGRTSQNVDDGLGIRLTTSSNTNGVDLSQTYSQKFLLHQSDGSLSPQRNQSFIAAVISAIRNATTPSSKKLLARNGKRICIDGNVVESGGELSGQRKNNNNNTNQNKCNGETQSIGGGDDSDSTEMLDSETEPCLMMDNVLEDVTMPDSHSHNMVSSCTGIISQIEIPSDIVNPPSGDESLHNLSQAIVNRQQMELQISNMQSVQKASLQMNQCEHDNLDDVSCHDSVAEMPSLMEYCTAQAVVDQVIEVDCLVTKLLKVLRLIQMDNDNCIQQLIVDKNKLQENKEDMLEQLKDLQDVNIKLQDELMDATQELMLKNNDLSNTKAEMQRHRNEIDVSKQKQDYSNNERLRVYANQLENALSVLQTCEDSKLNFEDLKKLRHDIEIVKANANWVNIINQEEEVNSNGAKLTKADTHSNNCIDEDVNANASIGELGEEVNC